MLTGRGEISVAHTVPDNSLMLITEQVFLFDYSNNHNNRAMSKYSDVTD